MMKTAIAFLASLSMCVSCGAVSASALRAITPVRSGQAESRMTGETQVDGIFDKMVDQLWHQTDVEWHHGDYPRVVALNRIIVCMDPHFIDAYGNDVYLLESMGVSAKDDNQPDEAANFISQAEALGQQSVRNNPYSSQAYRDLGMCYFNFAHDYAAAEAAFQQAVNVCPDVSILEWKMLAHSYEKEQRIDEAVATWQEIKRRYPNGPAVDANLNGDLARQKAFHAQNKPSGAPSPSP